MLRSRGATSNRRSVLPTRYGPRSSTRAPIQLSVGRILPLLIFILALMTISMFISLTNNVIDNMETQLKQESKESPSMRKRGKESLSKDFQGLIDRAKQNQNHCKQLNLVDNNLVINTNNHTVHLPQSGIIKAINEYNPSIPYPYQCVLPPEQECGETKFTVVFMAYNPDRIQKLYNQIVNMLTDNEFKNMVEEVVVVWNGERSVTETKLGNALVEMAGVRFSYPLQNGFPNDLMNRYHPRLDIKTKAIMYYDDDGPFYSPKATLGGFELWKRNANAQIGAMARKLDLGPRQLEEKKQIASEPADRFFISHCPKDKLKYNYYVFANYGANMVLPSGSFLHSNYLCFLWHPLFEEVRQYVKDHPVHPDDGTVSIIVSQLAGRAPKVYSRRINESKDDEKGMRRRLMQNMDWDKPGNHEQKMNWGELRSDAANSLVRYFGSINSGSLGWCHGTPYQKGEQCKPEMAKIGYLPWMNEDHTPSEVCP